MSRLRDFLPATAIGLLIAQGLAAQATHPLLEDYSHLQEWTFGSQSIDLPAAGLHWRTDVAEWHLDSGRIWLQSPTEDGHITGLVFEGAGRFQMVVPDPMELRQLRRFTGEDELRNLQVTFESMIMRGVDLAPLEQLPQSTSAGRFSSNSLAKQRHQHWLVLRGFDVDARVVAALASPGDAYFRTDLKTKEHGWLTFDFDGRRPEEILVEWFNPAFSVLESWVSLDKQSDRLPTGRPRGDRNPRVDVDHVAVQADLTRFASESQRGAARIRPMDVRIDVEITFRALSSGDRALQLFLHPWAKVESVRDESSNELAYLRDHLGKRSSAIEKKVYDDSLVVLLESPLVEGDIYSIDLTYELELSGYAPGRSWYPSATHPGSGVYDLHTADLSVEQRPNFASKSLGASSSEESGEKLTTVTWQMDEPVKMLSIVFAKNHHEETFETAGSTAVSAFSSLGGFISKPRVRQLGKDAARIVEYLEDLLGYPARTRDLTVSLIPSTHGQAFNGLIHIGDFSTMSDRVAEREMFRAHEIAHLWWGHLVGWHSYRDQWLSEGFAEYTAMLFVQARVEKGEQFFQEMLQAFSDELTGSIKSDFSQFSRSGFSLLNKRAGDRVGPPGHGRRCLVGEAPTAYFSQTYKKGALTLNSLRAILRAKTGSDEAFHKILRNFVDTYAGRFPSTEDFQAIVEDTTEENWGWFFDAWIYTAAIPTYEWSFGFVEDGQELALHLDVEQRHVEPGFTMAIPIRLEFEDDTEQTVLAFMDEPAKSFQFALEERPKQVIFNPDNAVLARVKKN